MYIVEENDNRFCLKNSTVQDAGLGCFANKPMKAGEYLEVIGVYVKIGSAADRCTHYANRYKFAAKEGGTCYIVPMGYGGMVNHTDDPRLQNVEMRLVKNLAKRSQHAGQIVYMAIRDIQEGEELLGNYGAAAGGEIKWANDSADFLDRTENEWRIFMGHDLYNLGLLAE